MSDCNISEEVKKYKYSMAIWSDSADFITANADLKEDKLLEIRCFDENGEFHAVRSELGEPFSFRRIHDKESKLCDEGAFFDESQYLDIDSARTEKENDNYIYATGGGRYHLPVDKIKNSTLPENDMLLVRYYYRFDDDGVANIYDWRLVGFTDKETAGKER